MRQNDTKTFVITGAAHGLGQALSRQLHQPNHQLILIDKDLKALNRLYDELEQDGWQNVYLFPMDLLGSAQQEFAQLSEGLQGFEHIDGLILNAGILPALTPIEHFDAMQWYEVMQTNLNANFHLIQACLNSLKQAQCPWLVAISDQALGDQEHRPQAYYGAYSVAKAGLEQLIRLTQTEHAQHFNSLIARLPAIAGHFRSKLYPGEPPCQNLEAEQAAQIIIATLLEQDVQAAHKLDLDIRYREQQ